MIDHMKSSIYAKYHILWSVLSYTLCDKWADRTSILNDSAQLVIVQPCYSDWSMNA